MNPKQEIQKDLDLAAKVEEDYKNLAAMARKTSEKIRYIGQGNYWRGYKDALHMALFHLEGGKE